MGGKLEVGGGVTVGGELELGGGLNARGNRITNAYLENPSVRGRVLGGVVVEGGMKIGELATDGGAGAEVGGDDGIGRKIRMVAAGPGGELRTTRGMGFDDENGVLVAPKIAGHQVRTREWEESTDLTVSDPKKTRDCAVCCVTLD